MSWAGIRSLTRAVRLLAAGMLFVVSAPVAGRAQVQESPAHDGAAHDAAGHDTGIAHEGPQGPGRVAYLEGMSLMVAGLAPAAADAFEKAIALEPSEPRYHNNLTAVLLQSNSTLEAAEDAALRGLEHVPDHPSLWVNLGIARHRLGRTSEAVQALEKGVELAPESGEGHAWLARAYWRLAGAAEPVDALLLARAVTSMRSAAAHQPNSPVVHFQLAMLLELTGDVPAALASYRTASGLAPHHPQGRAKVAELEGRLGVRDSATAPATPAGD